MTSRPNIPRDLEREVKMETGYRCAIPACRQTPVEIAHIVPWERVNEHTFDNLIALCPTCHSRYDYSKEIDRRAMLQYKANLSVVNGRYCDLEQRILRLFSKNPGVDMINILGGLEILLMNLLEDNLLSDTGQNSGVIIAGIPSFKTYQLTSKGRDFVNRWNDNSPLE